MNLRSKKSPQRGTVLILALWTLGLLTIFAIGIGVKVQQKIKLASRLEKRTKLYYASEAGVKKAVSLLKKGFSKQDFLNKTRLYSDPSLFKGIPLGSLAFDVFSGDDYGVIDEERKLNINTSDRATLENLFKEVTTLDNEGAANLASAIMDWHTQGESEMTGFYSDEYYENLASPYKQKKADFETIDELLLVKGVTSVIYKQIFPYVTIFGDGKVNLNTASKPVLKALGLSDDLINRMIVVRRGPDGREATLDDIIFPPGEDVLPIFEELLEASPADMQTVSDLFRNQKIGGQSSFFMIQSRGYLHQSKEEKVITCVFDLNSSKIKYWREEY